MASAPLLATNAGSTFTGLPPRPPVPSTALALPRVWQKQSPPAVRDGRTPRASFVRPLTPTSPSRSSGLVLGHPCSCAAAWPPRRAAKPGGGRRQSRGQKTKKPLATLLGLLRAELRAIPTASGRQRSHMRGEDLEKTVVSVAIAAANTNPGHVASPDLGFGLERDIAPLPEFPYPSFPLPEFGYLYQRLSPRVSQWLTLTETPFPREHGARGCLRARRMPDLTPCQDGNVLSGADGAPSRASTRHSRPWTPPDPPEAFSHAGPQRASTSLTSAAG
jgi:hypothetical protein